ncbi:MAG: stkP 3 [Schlesneria sp.]|nr:stkP 3 [Schlesneria sp.]
MRITELPFRSQPERATQVSHVCLPEFRAETVAKESGPLVLGNYVLLEKIGQGGMGTVYKAEHRRMKRLVAIKMLPLNLMQNSDAAARFQREVEAAAKLRHANIIAADDAGEANGIRFLVMEYVDGIDLSALVKKSGPLTVTQAISSILQVARGLEFAHSEGVVHRDIKPANMLLDKKGTVKILDLGLARIEGNTADQAALTGAGTVLGTVDYMAPEQALDAKHADARADIYSLGCSLYYLLTGSPVYDGDTLTARLLAHQNQPIPSLRDRRADVPRQLNAVFQKMVAKKVTDRYQSMTQVIRELESCLHVFPQTIHDSLLNLIGDTQVTPPSELPQPVHPQSTVAADVAETATILAGEITRPLRTSKAVGSPTPQVNKSLTQSRRILVGRGIVSAMLAVLLTLSCWTHSPATVTIFEEPAFAFTNVTSAGPFTTRRVARCVLDTTGLCRTPDARASPEEQAMTLQPDRVKTNTSQMLRHLVVHAPKRGSGVQDEQKVCHLSDDPAGENFPSAR